MTLLEQIKSGSLKVILGSKSPRRSELLRLVVGDFEVCEINCEEVYPTNLRGGEIAAFLSQLKSQAFRALKANELLITADTIVWMNDQIYEKPKSREEAEEMLSELSGNNHYVYTGVTLKHGDHSHSFVAATEVKFGDFTAEAIGIYVNQYEPLDKAGAYGIQDCLSKDGNSTGPLTMSIIQGSYHNVIGLPTEELEVELSKLVLN